MKLSGNRLRTSKGKILHFKSKKKRDTFERINNIRKHMGAKWQVRPHHKRAH